MSSLPKLYKLTHESDIHNGYHFHSGLNVDPNPWSSTQCSSGGFYLTTLEHLPLWTRYGTSSDETIEMTFVWDAEIILDQEYQQEEDKFKAHAIRLSNKRNISELSVWNDETYCRKACKMNPWCLKYIQNPSSYVLEIAVREDGLVLQWIEKLNLPMDMLKHLRLLAILNEGMAIQYIQNPDHSLQKEAVRDNGHAIKYIPNASDDIREMAINENAYSIYHMRDPSPSLKLQMLAVELIPDSLGKIENPFPEVQLAAVSHDGYTIQYIENPSKQLQLAAVQQREDSMCFIEDADEEVQLEAVKKDSEAIRFIANPSEKVQLKAVSEDGKSIRHLFAANLSVSVAVQLAAVRDCGYAIKFIPNPCMEVQIEAVKQYPRAILYIQNPFLEVMDLVHT